MRNPCTCAWSQLRGRRGPVRCLPTALLHKRGHLSNAGVKVRHVLGTRRFASLVGREAATGILETARTFGAEEARTIGFAAVAEIEEWPQIVADAAHAAQTLGDGSRAALYRAVSAESPDADLATLVRSAAQPGLKDRLRAYVQARE